MDPHPPTGIKPPTPTDAGSESRARAPSQMYALQVRAFIEASEVVDIDPDTIEDILDGFNGDIHVEGDSDDEEDMPDAFAEGNAGAQAQAEQEEDEEDEEFNILLEEGRVTLCNTRFMRHLIGNICSRNSLVRRRNETHDVRP